MLKKKNNLIEQYHQGLLSEPGPVAALGLAAVCSTCDISCIFSINDQSGKLYELHIIPKTSDPTIIVDTDEI